jgi:hypothetical protein
VKPFEIAEAFMEQRARGVSLPELRKAFEKNRHWFERDLLEMHQQRRRVFVEGQYENAYLTYPPEVARHFPKPLRELLGYRIHRPNLGGYEGQDPSVLFEGHSHTLAAVAAISAATAAELRHFYESA